MAMIHTKAKKPRTDVSCPIWVPKRTEQGMLKAIKTNINEKRITQMVSRLTAYSPIISITMISIRKQPNKMPKSIKSTK